MGGAGGGGGVGEDGRGGKRLGADLRYLAWGGRGGEHVADDNGRAAPGESERARPADTACGPGDQGDLPVELAHHAICPSAATLGEDCTSRASTTGFRREPSPSISTTTSSPG